MKKPYLCSVKNGTGGSVERLDYGVMVTQQILVLFFQVRVLVVQLKKRGESLDSPLFLFYVLREFMYNKKENVFFNTLSLVYIKNLYLLMDSSITSIFFKIKSKSVFSFSTFRFIS